jgi:hypothetical protein
MSTPGGRLVQIRFVVLGAFRFSLSFLSFPVVGVGGGHWFFVRFGALMCGFLCVCSLEIFSDLTVENSTSTHQCVTV